MIATVLSLAGVLDDLPSTSDVTPAPRLSGARADV